MDGFSDYREAARHAIEAVGGEAVLVEDFPSLPISSRTACLDGVASSDALLVIVGERGGWRAPSGKLVVEEEFEEARKRNIPVTLLIQQTERDVSAQELVARMSDYVTGLFRKSFTTPEQLNQETQDAFRPQVLHFQEPMVDSSIVTAKINEQRDRYHQDQETTLRFVLAPERGDEFIDPVHLDSEEFKHEIYGLGTSYSVRLLSHEHAKNARVQINAFIVEQRSENNRQGVDNVTLEIASSGVITVDVNVTGRQPANALSMASLQLVESDIVAGLQRCISFTSAVYQNRDPYHRYGRFHFNAALNNLGYRSLVSEPIRGSSMTVSTSNPDRISAFDEPRLITLEGLESPSKEIERCIVMFRRRLQNTR